MPERQARWARHALAEKRSAPDYKPHDMYDESVDEEACFEELQDHEMPSGLSCYAQEATPCTPKKGWRLGHNSVRKIAPQVRMAQFQAQIAAADRRGPLPYHTEDDILRRQIHRDRTWAKLNEKTRLAIKLEKKLKRQARFQEKVEAADKKHWEKYRAEVAAKLCADTKQVQAQIAEVSVKEVCAGTAAELKSKIEGTESCHAGNSSVNMWVAIKYALWG
jgi:hypothetical protein